MCRVYGNGDIDIMHPNGFVYEIGGETLNEDWVAHIREKDWVNQTDFLCAYLFALMERYYGRSEEKVQSKILSSAS